MTMKKKAKKRLRRRQETLYDLAIRDGILTINELDLINEIITRAADRYFEGLNGKRIASGDIDSLLSQYQLTLGDEQ